MRTFIISQTNFSSEKLLFLWTSIYPITIIQISVVLSLTFTMIPQETWVTLAHNVVAIAFTHAVVLARVVGKTQIMF